jgi:hypothetical protein
MDKQQASQFVELITALAMTFRVEADSAVIRGYLMALDDLPLSRVTKAVRTAMRQCKFMPTAAELRELAGEISGTARAQIVWKAVIDAMSWPGAYASVDFDDKVVNAAIHHLGGWVRVCDIAAESNEKCDWLRREFEKSYAKFWESGIPATMAGSLAGISALENAGTRYSDRTQLNLIATGIPSDDSKILKAGSTPLPLTRSRGIGGPDRIGNILS